MKRLMMLVLVALAIPAAAFPAISATGGSTSVTDAIAPAAASETSGVALNEVNCAGTDWVEVINGGGVEVSLEGWLLTDDPLDRVPLRDSHRMRFGADAVLEPGARLVVSQGSAGFPFGLSCGDDTLRLADASDTLVDAVTLPVPAGAGTTYGRIPDATGPWTWTLPTAGTANAVTPDTPADDPAWLYDPLQVTEVDLEASAAALAQLSTVPDEYVEARITLHSRGSTYGPYVVGLRLKGHGTFRPLDGKAAFKVKFGYAVSGQSFYGLEGLTLNNMVQDPSMIAEATASLLVRGIGAPTARSGYAYVRLNGADYGLYANVENVDSVMARHLFAGTQHIYEAGTLGLDVAPGREREFEVDEGPSTNVSDLEAFAAANSGSAAGWFERMEPVADRLELARAFAAEHYIGHWDGYSVPAPSQPNNYYLHSDLAGRFSLIVSGTDQAWLERSPFGVYGRGVLMRGGAADAAFTQLYIDVLRGLADNPAVAALPAQARTIRAVIAPWRERDPRREQTAAEGEAQADAKIATMEARPAELAAWLEDPSFRDATEPWVPGSDEPAPPTPGPTPAPTTPAPTTPAPTTPAPATPAPATPAQATPARVTPAAGPTPRTPLAPAPVARPKLGKAVGVPAKPIAGKRFTFTLRVTPSNAAARLLTGRMDGQPSVAGKAIRHTESFKAGTEKVSFIVPKTAKGKVLKVKIKIPASGQTASQTYRYTVR